MNSGIPGRVAGKRRPRVLAGQAVAVALAAALALAGCGSDDSSGGSTGSTSSPGNSSSTGGSDDAVAAAQALLDAASAGAVTGPSVGILKPDQIVPWQASDMPAPTAPPADPLDIAVVYSLPAGFPPFAADVIKAVGEEMGWTVSIFAASAPTPPAALAAMQQAVLDKPDAIISIVNPGVWVGPALEAAHKAGIYTVDVNQDSSSGEGYDGWVPGSKGAQKALLAAWAVVDSGGKAKSLIFDAPGFTDTNAPAAEDYFKNNCPGCDAELLQLNPNVFVDPTQTPGAVKAALDKSDGVGYVIWPTGGLPLAPVLNGISSSRNKDAKLIVDEPSAENVQLLKDGTIPVVVQAPAVLLLLEAIDDVNRLVQGQDAIAEDAIRPPVTFWTKDTAPDPSFSAITAAQLEANDWLSPFEEAWGVQLKDVILGVDG